MERREKGMERGWGEEGKEEIQRRRNRGGGGGGAEGALAPPIL